MSGLFIVGVCLLVYSSTCNNSTAGHHSTWHLLWSFSIWDRNFHLAVLSCVSLTLLTITNEFCLLNEGQSMCDQGSPLLNIWQSPLVSVTKTEGVLMSLIECRMCIINLLGKVGVLLCNTCYVQHPHTQSFPACSHWRLSLLVLQSWDVWVTVWTAKGLISGLNRPVSVALLDHCRCSHWWLCFAGRRIYIVNPHTYQAQ